MNRFLCAALVFSLFLAASAVARAEPVVVAEEIYGQALETLDGETVHLSDYKGTWTLVVFWASWCSPCRREIPHLKEIHAQYGGREDFTLVGLSLDETDAPLETLVHNTGIEWPVVRLGARAQQVFSDFFAVKSIPHFVLIDPAGAIHENGIRGRKLDRELEKLLQPAEDSASSPSSASDAASSR